MEAKDPERDRRRQSDVLVKARSSFDGATDVGLRLDGFGGVRSRSSRFR
jgi:hypothetical protein